jgi:hypothetical protein
MAYEIGQARALVPLEIQGPLNLEAAATICKERGANSMASLRGTHPWIVLTSLMQFIPSKTRDARLGFTADNKAICNRKQHGSGAYEDGDLGTVGL